MSVLTTDYLDDLVHSLKQDHTHVGIPYDPCNVVPHLVAEVADTLGVPTDSARYFLQILALVYPTDTNIRAWNHWRTKNIEQAAAPLLEKGLLIEATRSNAQRKYFLPGTWLERFRPRQLWDRSNDQLIIRTMPMEAWKAPLYLLWKHEKCYPLINGCPPIYSLEQLFTKAWGLYKDGA